MIQVEANTVYTMSGWLNDSLSSGNVYIDWLEYDASNQIVVDGEGIYPRGKNQWQHGNKTFTTHPSTVKLVLRMVVEGNVNGSAFIDGIGLVKGSPAVVYAGSFELGQAKWNISPLMTVERGEVKEGNSSLKFSGSAAGGAVSDSGAVQAEPNTVYTMSGWLNDSLSSGNVYIDWLEYDANNQMVVDGIGIYPRGKNQWQYGDKTFTTHPSTVKLILRMVVEGNVSGSVFIDGIQLHRATY